MNSQNAETRPTVAHVNHIFLSGTETFIYHYVSHHKRFKPVCLASKFMNAEQFPFPEKDMLPASHRRYTPAWAFNTAVRQFSGIDLFLNKQTKRSGCQIIHAHYGPMGCIALSSKKSLGIPLVTTFYGFDLFQKEVLERNKRRYARLFRDGDLFLVLGPHMRERLIGIGCPPEKVEVQRNAIPAGRISLRLRKPKKQGEKVRILFAGSFYEKKGLIFALEALKQVTTETPDFELRIIGFGPLRDRFEAYVREEGLNQYVRFLGYLPYSEYLAEVDAADIFLHPSVTAADGNSEGAPTAILEAQANGLPVISTYHSDIPSIVVPGKSALLSQERDVASLADNISYLIKNQNMWEEMGREGRRLIEKYHDVEKEVDALEERYERLLH